MQQSATDRRYPWVRRLYQFGGARWYDAFRTVWTRVTSPAAEATLDQWLREAARDECRVLDIGCGTGFNLGRLQRLGVPFRSYLGVDLTDAMLAIARTRYADERRAIFVEANLSDLAGTPERFDVILCTWVASHLDHPREVFDLAYDLLAPSGHAFLLVMTQPRWHIFWWLAPLARLFQARFVDLEPLGDLRGLKRMETSAAGLATVFSLLKGTASSTDAPPTMSARTGGMP